MPRTAPPGPPCEIRALRLALQRSQPAFAALLGVAAETYRTWDSGRRATPDPWLAKARTLAAREDPARLWSLEALAAELGVHVRTLRNAARSGRLCVTFEPRVVFGHLVPRATLAAGRTFIERYYKQCYSRTAPTAHAPPAHTGACRLATTAAANPGRPCPHPNPAGPADRGGGESRHLSVGIAQATAVTRVLDED